MGALRSYGYSVVDSYPPYQQVMATNGWNDLRPLWNAPGAQRGRALIPQAFFDLITTSGLVDVPAGS